MNIYNMMVLEEQQGSMHSLMVLLFEFYSIRAFHTICEGDCWSQGMAQQHRASHSSLDMLRAAVVL